MSRYLIIDTQAETAKDCVLLGEVLANPGLYQFQHFLSEEETMKKFKDVFDSGISVGEKLNENRRTMYGRRKWNKFSKNL